jgi:hypothetical protein
MRPAESSARWCDEVRSGQRHCRARSLIAILVLAVAAACGGGSGGEAPPGPSPPPAPDPPPADFPVKSRALDFGFDFGGIVSSPSRGRIYASVTSRNEIIAFSADTYLEVDRFYVGPEPGVLALSADESRLYVALTFGGGIAIIDLDTDAVQRVDVPDATRSIWITAITEARPGLVLVGATSTRYPTQLVTVDVEHGNSLQIVASRQSVGSADDFAFSPDRKRIYVADNGNLEPPQYLLELDASRDDLPLLSRVDVPTINHSIAVSPDGLRLYNGGGTFYSTADFTRLRTGEVDGVIGSGRDGRFILRALGPQRLYRLEETPKSRTYHKTDCPPRLVDAVHATERRDEWMLDLAGIVCVVSFSAPDVPPARDADRTLPAAWPEHLSAPYAEIPLHGGFDILLDEPRKLLYASIYGENRIAVLSLDTLEPVDSIAAPGEVGRIFLSRDQQTLYADLYEQGSIIEVDLETRQIRSKVDLAELLGRDTVGDIVELGPRNLIVGAYAAFAEPTWLVHVDLAAPESAERVGCMAGYGGTGLFPSPDRHYLYVTTNSARCPLLEKRDLTQPDLPIVKAADPYDENYLSRRSISSDGRHILGGGAEIISADTLWSTGLVQPLLPGGPIASRDPDKYYYIDGLGGDIATVRISDYAVTSFIWTGCPTFYEDDNGYQTAVLTSDERYIIIMDEGNYLCVVELPHS